MNTKLASEKKEWYLSRFPGFEANLNGNRAGELHQTRKKALEAFNTLGFPSNRHEEWKYTNVTPLLKEEFEMGVEGKVIAADVAQFTYDDFNENVLVFVNGHYSAELSRCESLGNGVSVKNLSRSLHDDDSSLKDHLFNYASFDDEAFTALNTAFTQDGTVIIVDDNADIKNPLQLLYLSDAREEGTFNNPRNLVVAGTNSRIKIVETFHALGDKPVFNNVVTEAVVAEGGNVEYIRIQEENTNSFHICNFQTELAKSSNFSLLNFDLGSRLVRNNLGIRLGARDIEAHLIGFYMGTGNQHMDSHTTIDHAMPNCLSNELYKGVLGGKARGVFNGKVFVRKDAQKTNAYQTNQAMLLTDTAGVDTKPQLEIYADDVKCSHGATVGQMDEEAVFYLRSRGIPEEVARAQLQYAFASDVFNYVSIESVRNRLDEKVLARFANL
ncbi:MAG: Fe-S cluster assembly protein SufD [Calditrichia bacterium]